MSNTSANEAFLSLITSKNECIKLTTYTNKTRSHDNLNVGVKDEDHIFGVLTRSQTYKMYKVETTYWIVIYMRFHCTEKQLESTAADPLVDTQSSLRMLIEVAHELIEFFHFGLEHA